MAMGRTSSGARRWLPSRMHNVLQQDLHAGTMQWFFSIRQAVAVHCQRHQRTGNILAVKKGVMVVTAGRASSESKLLFEHLQRLPGRHSPASGS